MALWCDRNVNDDISTGKMPENTKHSQVFSGIFLVEMTSSMFLSVKGTKAVFYLF